HAAEKVVVLEYCAGARLLELGRQGECVDVVWIDQARQETNDEHQSQRAIVACGALVRAFLDGCELVLNHFAEPPEGHRQRTEENPLTEMHPKEEQYRR